MTMTGLPYDMDKMADFYENGGTINMADIKFPGCKTFKSNLKSAFIYLRNTNYDMKYDFTGMEYDQKKELLIEYLETKTDYSIPELNETWLSIFYACVGIKATNLRCILNDLELITFQSAEFEYVQKWWRLIISLPLYAIIRLKTEIFKTPKNIETVEDKLNLVNFYHVMNTDGFDGLFDYVSDWTQNASGVSPANYTKLFTEDNNKLFESLMRFKFMSVFNFILDTPPTELENALQQHLTKLGLEDGQ